MRENLFACIYILGKKGPTSQKSISIPPRSLFSGSRIASIRNPCIREIRLKSASLNEDTDMEEEDESGDEMEEDEQMDESEDEEEIKVAFPEKKSVTFAQKAEKVDPSNLRQLQKVNKRKLKRKDKFETKLSQNVEKALNLM